MYWIGEDLRFPSHEMANEDGVLALGGDLSVKRLVLAYSNGIFPWFNEGEPIVWYSPRKRMVLFPEELKVSKSMKQIIRKAHFRITENNAFKEVIFSCRHIQRRDQLGTWITDDMEDAYIHLHDKGLAKSIEVWYQDKLVGGLYGVDLGNGIFCGESMFSAMSNASKLAFIYLAQKKAYTLIDCQIYNEHLSSMGAREIQRAEFLQRL